MKKIGVVNSLVLSVCDTNHQGLFLAIPIRCSRLDLAIHSMKLNLLRRVPLAELEQIFFRSETTIVKGRMKV